uniref:Uncharacterized protein n=1 Tax=Arundo donax TaxID=35708 RepID=A0A0A8ZZC5_ARUDO
MLYSNYILVTLTTEHLKLAFCIFCMTRHSH